MAGISKYFEASLAIVGTFFPPFKWIAFNFIQLTYQLKILQYCIRHAYALLSLL